MKIYADTKSRQLLFDRREENGTFRLFFDKKPLDFEFVPLGGNRYSLIRNHVPHLLHIIEENGLYHIHMDGEYFAVRIEDERMRALRELVAQSSSGGGDRTITAPIPGMISRILVSEGQKIAAGESLIILEAMKMENELRAEDGGYIKKIMIETGKPAEKDQPLLIITQESQTG